MTQSREAAPRRFVLAPMDGMTHASFRSICFEYGADGATTEMIQSLAYGRAKKRMSAAFEETLVRFSCEKNLAAQLIGSEPKMMEAVKSATALPVRLKLRLGWDAEHITAPQIALAAQQIGYESVTLHGRTRMQMYRGAVDLPAMKAIVASLSIPVYANGGVTDAASALAFLIQTGAAGVSIGRAALKQPWIFDDIRRLERGEPLPERDAAERIGLLTRLAELACGHRPERVAICEMRKFCGWLLPGLTGYEDVLRRLNGIVTLDGFRRMMGQTLDALIRRGDVHIHPELLPEASLDTVRQDGAQRR